jgi:hypothetical protein
VTIEEEDGGDEGEPEAEHENDEGAREPHGTTVTAPAPQVRLNFRVVLEVSVVSIEQMPPPPR